MAKERPAFVERLLEGIDELTDQIETADKELVTLAEPDQAQTKADLTKGQKPAK